jgi:hypothetical protein
LPCQSAVLHDLLLAHEFVTIQHRRCDFRSAVHVGPHNFRRYLQLSPTTLRHGHVATLDVCLIRSRALVAPAGLPLP